MSTRDMTVCRSIAIAVVFVGLLVIPRGSHSAPKGLRLQVGAAYGSLATAPGFVVPTNSPSANFNATITSIDSWAGIGGGIGWQFNSGLGVFVAAGYSYGSATYQSLLTDAIGNSVGLVDFEYRVATVPVSIGADYRRTRGHWAVVADGAFQVNYIDFTTRPQDAESLGLENFSMGDATALGATFGFAIEWVPIPQLSAGARAGYRSVEQVRVWFYDVDFSGPTLTAYLEYRPWWHTN